MGQPITSHIVISLLRIHSLREAIPEELKHLSKLRKRNHRDSPSSGERNGNSLNLKLISQETSFRGCGTPMWDCGWIAEVSGKMRQRE